MGGQDQVQPERLVPQVEEDAVADGVGAVPGGLEQVPLHRQR